MTTLGSPDTTSSINGEAYYYISTTQKSYAFFKPWEIDRKVVAVYFNRQATVENVKRALDSGAYGVIAPMINTREEAEQFVAAARFPPQGQRSWPRADHWLFRSSRVHSACVYPMFWISTASRFGPSPAKLR